MGLSELARTAAGAVAIAAISVATASPASAVWWKSQSDPLFAYENGKPQTAGYGNFYNDGSVSAMSTSWQKDLKPGGDGVAVETAFWFHEYNTPCGCVTWDHDTTKQTTTTFEDRWIKLARARNLHSGADAVRGVMRVHEVHNNDFDPISSPATISFDY